MKNRIVKCYTCDGVGYVKKTEDGEIFTMKEAEKITEKMSTEVCPDCEGCGEVDDTENYFYEHLDEMIKNRKEASC